MKYKHIKTIPIGTGKYQLYRGEDGALYDLTKTGNIGQPAKDTYKKIANKGEVWWLNAANGTTAVNPYTNEVTYISINEIHRKSDRVKEAKRRALIKPKAQPKNGNQIISQNKIPVKNKWVVAQNDWSYNGRKIKKGDIYMIGSDNSVTIKPKDNSKTIKPKEKNNNQNMTNKKVTYSPLDLTNMNNAQLKARNDAMARGWASYNYNGQTYNFEKEDLANARNNWRINKGKLNHNADGLLGLSKTSTEKLTTPITQSVNGQSEIGFTPDMMKPGVLNTTYNTVVQDNIRTSRERAVTPSAIPDDYNGTYAMHFGTDRNWANMNDEQKLNYLQLMDKAIDPNNKNYSLYTSDGTQITNTSDNPSYGKNTLVGLYNTNRAGFNDYMTNFRGEKWDTATEEGMNTWNSMLDYYNKNWKTIDKTLKKEKIQANSRDAYKRIYDMYSNSLLKSARQGTKLIRRK